MFARLSPLLIAIALVFGSVHAGPGSVEHHHDHDSASQHIVQYHHINMPSVQQDIALNSDSSDQDNNRDVEGDTHQHFSPTADRLNSTKIESINYAGRSLVFASAAAVMPSWSQAPPTQPPSA